MFHFPIRRHRLFNDPFDRLFGDQLSFFDPWRDYDTFPTAFSTFPNSFRWINEPPRMIRSSSSSSKINSRNGGGGLLPITTSIVPIQFEQEFSDGQSLSLFGQFRDPFFDYHGFIGSSDFRPRIVDIGGGRRQIKMSLEVKNYRPEQIKVSVKNNELLVQAENIYQDSNRSERSFLTKSITLPPGTQIDQLKSFLNNDGQFEIEAPFSEPTERRSIEVERT